jgi:hypothetical protein
LGAATDADLHTNRTEIREAAERERRNRERFRSSGLERTELRLTNR